VAGTGTSSSSISIPTTPRPTTTTQGAGGPGGAAPPGTQVSLFDAAPGECWDQAELSGSQEYTVLDCAGPHDTETFAVFDLPDGPFPGTDAVREAGADGCLERFEPYVGTDYASSIYYQDFYSPTEDTWNDATLRDREVVCILFVPLDPGDPAQGLSSTTGTGYQSGR
jgi:hypothetical protein